MRRGLWVFIALVVVTVAEYGVMVAVPKGNLPYMVVMNIVDAGLIAYFFMHIMQLGRLKEEE